MYNIKNTLNALIVIIALSACATVQPVALKESGKSDVSVEEKAQEAKGLVMLKKMLKLGASLAAVDYFSKAEAKVLLIASGFEYNLQKQANELDQKKTELEILKLEVRKLELNQSGG